MGPLIPTALSFGGLMGGLLLTVERSSKQKAFSERVETLLASHRTEISFGGGLLTLSSDNLSWIDRTLLLLGADRRRPYLTGSKPFIVIGLTGVASYLAALLGVFAVGRVAYLAVPLVWVFLSKSLFSRLSTRHADKLRLQMPDALAMIVRSVRVGIPIAESVRAVGKEAPEPTGALFRQIAGEIAIGIPIEDALRRVVSAEKLQEYRFFATALSLQSRTGGGLAETLENLAEVIRKRLAAKARGFALAAEARTSALVLACLPVFAIGALLFMSPHYILQLFVNPVGRKILLAAVASQTMGVGTMKIMIRKSLS